MNTDQAYEMLIDAGVTEENSILTVRRWLRERKITFEGKGQNKSGYQFNDTVQALSMLKDAGIAENQGMQIVQRWLSEGRVQNIGRKTEYISNGTEETRSLRVSRDSDSMIRQLKAKIKAQDEQIKGIEQLHQTSIHSLIQQRDKLQKEWLKQEKEKNELQYETKKLLRENMDLRNEVLKLKEELSKGTPKERKQQGAQLPLQTNDYRQKLGLSKSASQKEILAGYKKLLKVTHPDHGGSPEAFHYIKTEYDFYKNRMKG
ncbi:hypothetical protein [Neobacillus kokaensis]|uniref:J domain-containing protein n=1 Tax=Neobacillus kokaensis TaxID=2759023 RepID=A0ABQ3N457_9BACI|nr:hypothetical protein [Neobacillus kokaensis]GHH99497.1 hypothetical protein AM1BK_30400 [Neobacillus kokaensis]